MYTLNMIKAPADQGAKEEDFWESFSPIAQNWERVCVETDGQTERRA